jgi:hypothetical protein
VRLFGLKVVLSVGLARAAQAIDKQVAAKRYEEFLTVWQTVALVSAATSAHAQSFTFQNIVDNGDHLWVPSRDSSCLGLRKPGAHYQFRQPKLSALSPLLVLLRAVAFLH